MRLASYTGVSAAALAIAAPPASDLVAVFGDSISAQSVTTTATTRRYTDRGYQAWMLFHSGSRVRSDIEFNFGVSGDTLEMMEARVAAVIASGAKICVFLGGTNNLPAGTPLAVMQAIWLRIVSRLNAAGIRVLVVPILPRAFWNTAVAASILEMRKRKDAFNRFLFAQCRSRPGCEWVPVLELWTALYSGQTLDVPPGSGASATGTEPASFYTSRSEYAYDGLHPSNFGAFALGYAIAQVINRIVPETRLWATAAPGPAALYDPVNNPQGNALLNPQMLGSGGTAGTGASGTIPANWTIERYGAGSTTVVVSAVNKTLSNGKTYPQVQLVMTNGGATQDIITARQYRTVASIGYTPGSGTIRGAIEMEADASNGLLGAFLEINEADAGGVSLNQVRSASIADSSATCPFLSTAAFAGRAQTPSMPSVAGAINLQYLAQFKIEPGQTVTARIAEPDCTVA